MMVLIKLVIWTATVVFMATVLTLLILPVMTQRSVGEYMAVAMLFAFATTAFAEYLILEIERRYFA